MRIGIDISQTAHEGTGVAQYVTELILHLASLDKNNQYILFFSSMRKQVAPIFREIVKKHENFSIKTYGFPPTVLNVLWNKFHIMPIESLIGEIDVFLSSDWVQPPTSAKSMTILYDLIVYKYPKETDEKIVATQKRRLHWVKRECDKIICISKSTKKDAEEILGIDPKKLVVVYPGM